MSEHLKSKLNNLLESKLQISRKETAPTLAPKDILQRINDLLTQSSRETETINGICELLTKVPGVSGLAVFIVSAHALVEEKPTRITSIKGDEIPAPASKRTMSGTLHAINRDELTKLISTRYYDIPGLRKADGWLGVELEDEVELKEDAEVVLRAGALALGLSISRSNITKTIEEINQRVSVFQELTRLSASNATTDRIFEVLAKDAGFRIHANATLALFYDSDEDCFIPKGAYGIPKHKLPEKILGNSSQLNRALSLETIISVPDLSKSKDSELSFLGEFGFKSIHIAPLSLKEDSYGVLLLLYKKASTLSPEKSQLLQDQTQGGSIALAGARAREIMTHYTHELESLVEERTADLVVQTARADEANLAKSQFVANMSHELRTPLTAIVGYSSVLQEGLFGELNEEQGDALLSIVKAADHLKELINDVLDMSRIESGKEEARPNPISFEEFIPQIVKLMTQTAQGKQLELISPEPSELKNIIAFADNRHARQILINIVSNAVKYTPPNGIITISVQSVADKVAISVADTGVGIPTSQRDSVFQEYSRLEDEYSQKQIGTGLGLNLTKKLIELNGGSIDFESEVGVGTTFTYTLPVYEEPSDEQVEFDPNSIATDSKDTTVIERIDGLSVLILEDDTTSLKLLSAVLTHVGAEVYECTTIEDAKKTIESHVIDVAIIDLALKGESGVDFLSFLNNNYSNIPSIVVSACVFEKDEARAMEAGALSFIKKPFEPHELIRELRNKTIERVLVR